MYKLWSTHFFKRSIYMLYNISLYVKFYIVPPYVSRLCGTVRPDSACIFDARNSARVCHSVVHHVGPVHSDARGTSSSLTRPVYTQNFITLKQVTRDKIRPFAAVVSLTALYFCICVSPRIVSNAARVPVCSLCSS